MVLYIDSLKESTAKRLLEILSKFNKVAGYKINMQKKSVVFLCASNKYSKNEIKKKISFRTA